MTADPKRDACLRGLAALRNADIAALRNAESAELDAMRAALRTLQTAEPSQDDRAWAAACARRVYARRDPLSVEYDGIPLRDLITTSRQYAQLDGPFMDRVDRGLAQRGLKRIPLSPAQREAVSAHWSAELRLKVQASKERERCRVLVDLEDD